MFSCHISFHWSVMPITVIGIQHIADNFIASFSLLSLFYWQFKVREMFIFKIKIIGMKLGAKFKFVLAKILLLSTVKYLCNFIDTWSNYRKKRLRRRQKVVIFIWLRSCYCTSSLVYFSSSTVSVTYSLVTPVS